MTIFPPMVGHMVAVGEETGQLEHMLAKVADFYEAEVDAKVKALTSLIEPLMIVFVGGMVGLHRHLDVPADVHHLRTHPLTSKPLWTFVQVPTKRTIITSTFFGSEVTLFCDRTTQKSGSASGRKSGLKVGPFWSMFVR